ncbi:hypothetical protein CIL03_02055 [Virgibacillus indicus]|uniref:Uncharacterized protein n=1 Tax=Virgibacillus indicus TaxID=2024554 RepID=A0A265NDQ8_9BACI|nr:hypothetical protein [Virgibacillus indicus]OZU89947.1 hypothetical protein CIL03_02055 [Virgibacillus indicus]
MADNRIATIIKEINYWKEHNLLPDVYCDFLLALYTKGEEETSPITRTKEEKITLIIKTILLLLLLPFSFLVLYFTQFRPLLQISIIFLFLTYSFWLYVNFKNKKHSLFHLTLGVTLAVILLASVYFTAAYTDKQIIIYLILMTNFLFWFLMGKIKKVKYLTVAAILGIVFAIFYIIL